MKRAFKARQKLGKYRISRRIASGGFAEVYAARDTVEGIDVALKVPHESLVTREMLDGFRKEARAVARLDHPNVLPLKTAGHIDGHFVIVQPLGEGTLDERLHRRVGLKLALDWSEQLLGALAHAHAARLIHCDVKPDNLLIFPGQRLRLADFGISKVAWRTITGAGTGTLGFIAPEQAMGKPSRRSDVFAAGLVIYRMVAGVIPEWPFEWPPPNIDRIRRVHKDLEVFLRKALELDAERRYRDAGHMLAAFRRIKPRLLQGAGRRRRRRRNTPDNGADWKDVRTKEFRRRFGKKLATHHDCSRCHGPISETMAACPWCGARRKTHRAETAYPARCKRCKRGVKLDWSYCPWCYGASIGPRSDREYTDRRYAARCSNKRCSRGDLMPFMRYCPWCRSKVRRAWRIEGSSARCKGCGCGVAGGYWDWCPWCTKRLPRSSARAR